MWHIRLLSQQIWNSLTMRVFMEHQRAKYLNSGQKNSTYSKGTRQWWIAQRASQPTLMLRPKVIHRELNQYSTAAAKSRQVRASTWIIQNKVLPTSSQARLWPKGSPFPKQAHSKKEVTVIGEEFLTASPQMALSMQTLVQIIVWSRSKLRTRKSYIIKAKMLNLSKTTSTLVKYNWNWAKSFLSS